MRNPIRIGLAVVMSTTVALAASGGGEDEKKNQPSLLDGLSQDTVVVYVPGEGLTIDGGDAYKLNVQGFLQVKWYYMNLENNPDTNSFQVRRARSWFSGHVWSKDVKYLLQLDYTTSAVLLDAFVDYTFVDTETADVAVQFGLGKFRSGSEADSNAQHLEFLERSVASRTFAEGRATGALFHGGFIKAEDDTNTLSWWIGAANNETAGASVGTGSIFTSASGTNAGDNHLFYYLGAHYDPWGDMGERTLSQGDLEHIGELRGQLRAGVTTGTTGSTAANNPTGIEVDTTTVNLAAVFKSGTGWAGVGEVWIRTDDPDVAGVDFDSNGWYIQGSYTQPPGEGMQWGGGLRFSMIDMDSAERKAMGQSARDRVRSEFELATVAGRYQEFYEDVLDRRDSLRPG